MKLFQTPILTAIGLTLCVGQAALAQTDTTPVGAVDATIDGMSYSGETLDVASEGTSTAELRSFGPMTSISIQAHDPKAENIMHNVLGIEVSLMGSETPVSIMDASVSWWPEGMRSPFYLSEDSGTAPEIVFDTLSLENENPAARGSFSAVVCRKEGMFSDSDLNDCLVVDGRFDTALRKAD
ncbi:hypothetical protein [Pontibaca salina]|uniref:Uncharacterized protein n=1 Tax=Pontibaca salina TaxID=2795731 RepID=A0A934M4C4_9RHOB|nr:hypothetical protein [Pontibaca salina]MBI6630764.1 hypothetical protein [Pontibaca salina]